MAENQPATGTPVAPVQAKPGEKIRLREYETLFLVKPEIADEGIERIKERIRAAVSRDGGKVIKFTNWGKKKTAFQVAKQPRAVYVHVDYLGNPGIVAEVERNLAITEDVSKYISHFIAEDIDPETRPVEPDAKLAGDADDRPRPEREAEGVPEKPEHREEEPGEESA